MAKDQHIYKMIIDGDISNLEQSMTKAVSMMKQKYSEMDRAADKVTHLKELVDYIAQIDKGLSALQTKDSNLFKKMFDGMDTGLRKMMEEVFGTSKTQLSGLDVLKDKLNQLSDKSRVTDIKAVATEINQLYEAIGKQAPIKLGEINSKTKGADLERLKSELQSFATVWADVNKKINDGFTFGGISGGSGSGSGSKSSISAEIQFEIDKIMTQIDELKRAKEELQKVAELQNTIKNKGSSAIPDSIEAYTTTEAVQDLITEFDVLEKELASGDKASADYANKLIKMSNIILTLQKSLKAVRADNTVKDLFQTVGSDQGDTMLGALSKYANNKSLKHVNEIISLGTIPQMDAKILDLENEANYLARPYDTLNEKLHEYIRLQEQMDSASGGELKSLYAQSDALREYIIALGEAKNKAQEVEDIFDNLFTDDDGLFAESDINNALEQLCNILGVQLPGAVNKAKDAFEPKTQSGKTSDGSDRNDGAGTGSGADFEDKIEVAINSEQLEQSISGLAGKLDTFSDQVHTSTQQITNSAGQLKTSVDNLTAAMQGPDEAIKAAAEREQQIEHMKQNLLDMFKRVAEHNNQMVEGSHTQQETTTEFFADGTARFGYGEKGTVPWASTLQNVLSNILSKSIMSVHSHPWGDFYGAAFRGAENSDRVFSNDAFSSSTGDLAAWRTLQRYGSQIGAMLTGNILRTFDTSKIGDKYQSFISNLRSVEDEYAQRSEYNKYFDKEKMTGKISLNYKNDLMGWQEAANALREVMFEALRRTGFSDSDIQGIYQEYDLTNDKQLTNLASTLVDLSTAAQSADSHIDALKGLLMEFGTSDKKDDIYSQWKRLSNDISNGNTLFAQDDFDALRDQIRDYGGNVYDTELNDIFSKYVNTGEFTKAANEMFNIIKTFGTDIESQEGQVALESLRKGELSVAEVWNRFSDFAKVSQEAIDSVQTINAREQEPTESQLMSRIASALDAINANVASIEANTQPTLKDSMDANTQTLMGLFNDGNANRITNGAKSLFDKDNISEFKALELYKLSDNVSAQFRTMFDDFEQAIPMGDLQASDVQNLFELYVTAVQRTQDALNQVNAYNTRYETDLAHPDTGELLSFNLEGELQQLTGQGSQIVESLLNMFAQARQHLANDMALDNSSDVSRNDYSNYGENSDLGAVLRTLAGAIGSLVARLGGIDYSTMQFESTSSNALGDTGNVDLSSEITRCTDLLDILGRIKLAVEAKTEAFEEEKATVNRVVVVEEDALEELKDYVDTLKDALKTLFENLPKDDTAFEAWKNDLIAIKENLDSVLSDIREINTLVPKDGQDLGQQTVNTNNTQGAGGYATENTLQGTNGILERIFGVISTDFGLINKITASLSSAADELKKVSNGIIEEHKRKKVDTSVADARLTDTQEVANIQQAALDAVSGRMMNGGNSAITGMTAMKDGVVKVTGWIQTATDAWEGFSVQVNEANQASKTAYDLSAKAAKMAAAQEKADNPYEYDKDEVEARAKKHLDEYTAQGKKATVQFKDSGRYTITVLEEIDGLSKQIFQTFDENDDKIERTTATISNNQKIKLDNLQKIIEAGKLDNTVSDQDIAYQQYKKAADELESMNNAYRQNNDISDEEILKWNQQIQLVQQLGIQVEALIKKKKIASAELNEVFKSKRTKELGRANLDYTNLKTDINIPENLVTEANNALKKIQNAVSEDDLKIAVNEWGAMKSKIQEAAVAQDLYIKKQKKVKDTTVDSAEKAKIALEKSNKSATLREIMAQTNSELKLTGIDVDSRKLTDRQKEISEAYKNVEAAAREYTANANAGLEANTNNIIAAREELYKLIDAYKKDYNIEDARKKTFGTTSVNRIVGKYNNLNDIATSKEFEGSDVVANKLKEYSDAIKNLKDIYGKFKAGEQITGDQEQQFNAARDECNKYGQELEKLIATSRKAAAAATRSDPIGADFVDDENGRLRALKQYVEDTYGATATIDKFTDANNKLFFTIDNGDGTFSKMCAEINSTRNAINVTTKSTEESTNAFKKFVDELKGKFKSIGAYLMASFSFQAVFQQIKKGVNYVREIDVALTELKKVTDETDETYNRFLQNMSKTASVVGSTVSDLTTMAAEWARLGYSIEEAGKLAESTAILLNVSEFENATDASEALISTMQAFQYTADESQHVVDILNEVKVTCLLMQ